MIKIRDRETPLCALTIGCTDLNCGGSGSAAKVKRLNYFSVDTIKICDAALTCDFDVDIIGFHVAWLDGERSDASNWRQVQTFARHRHAGYIELADGS